MTDTDLVALRDDLARLYGEDIAQEAILKLLEKGASGEVVEHPEHFCRKWAFGLTKEGQRRRQREVMLGKLEARDREDAMYGDGEVEKGGQGGLHGLTPNGNGNGWGWQIHDALTVPPTQQSRLEAQEALAVVDPRLVNEVIEGVPKMSKDSRKRVRRQASPHPHQPRTTRPGRCSRCGLGKDAGVHRVTRRNVA